jgi:hypothetical protein
MYQFQIDLYKDFLSPEMSLVDSNLSVINRDTKLINERGLRYVTTYESCPEPLLVVASVAKK